MKLRSLLIAVLIFIGMPLASSSAFVAVSIGIAPPPIPVYVQPACPVAGYIWVPGYWAYGDVGYYWVPGVWVPPPRIGVLWTPGYWGYNGGSYLFHSGYWGPQVGFYGGINYGFGYFGTGYCGGEWAGNAFRYNTAVTRVNTTIIHNTYVNKTVINNYATTHRRASFNGPGGINRQPTAAERTAAQAQHVQATPQQRKVQQAAKANPALHAANNHGHPGVAALKTPDQAGALNSGAKAQSAGKNGRNAGNRQAAAANDAQAPAAAANTGRGGANKRAAAKHGGPAGLNGGNADNGARHRATAMPAHAATPRLPQPALRHGNAAQAIADRGPQHRMQQPAVAQARAGAMQPPAAGRPRGNAQPGRAPGNGKPGKGKRRPYNQ